MSLAFVCSGQGGQHPEMFARLLDEPAAAPALEALAHELQLPVSALRGAWWDDAMQRNRPGQLLVVAHALAVAAVLRSCGVRASLCAGYSAGEMAAHGTAGVWSEQQAMALTAQRASCMDEAARECGVALAMLALVGLETSEAEALAHRHGAELALVNGPRHVVLGGPAPAIARVEAAAPSLGASHVRRLTVDVASHTGFLAPAGPRFASELQSQPWRAPECTLLSALDGRAIRSHADTVELLSRQLHCPLNWHQCMEAMREYGVRVVLEVGPGRALTRMFEEAVPGIEVRAFEEFRTPAGVAKWIERHAS